MSCHKKALYLKKVISLSVVDMFDYICTLYIYYKLLFSIQAAKCVITDIVPNPACQI